MNQNKLYEIIKIKTIEKTYTGDESGSLSFFESKKDIPFEIKRIYYISGVNSGSVRGYHAHKNLKQFLFCPFGKIELYLEDKNENKRIILNSPSTGVLIDHPVWREMKWIESNSVLCVAASDYYNEDDYIRNYNDFLAYIRED